MPLRSFPSRASNVVHPGKKGSARQYFDFYADRLSLSLNQVAQLAQIGQSHWYKILNKKIHKKEIHILVKIAIVLKLNQSESIDFFSRLERCFSPADIRHRVYEGLIEFAASCEINPVDYLRSPGGYLCDLLEEFKEERKKICLRDESEEIPFSIVEKTIEELL